MNQFNGFTKEVIAGYHAMLRFAEDGQAEPVLGKGGKPIVFPDELAAQKAVIEHLLRYMNGNLRRDGETIKSARAEIDRIFRKGKVIPVTHLTK